MAALLEVFGQLTGVPVLLNTSFNLSGEPIVQTEMDALRSYYSSGLDDLIIGHYWLSKSPPPFWND
jgi:carbamoyltransferase